MQSSLLMLCLLWLQHHCLNEILCLFFYAVLRSILEEKASYETDCTEAISRLHCEQFNSKHPGLWNCSFRHNTEVSPIPYLHISFWLWIIHLHFLMIHGYIVHISLSAARITKVTMWISYWYSRRCGFKLSSCSAAPALSLIDYDPSLYWVSLLLLNWNRIDTSLTISFQGEVKSK